MLKKLTSQLFFSVAIGFSGLVHAGSYEDFFTAIARDNASEITGLLKRGFDVNSRSTKGQHGLFEALQKDSQKAAVALLESAALDVNALNDKGESLLMMAALKGKVALRAAAQARCQGQQRRLDAAALCRHRPRTPNRGVDVGARCGTRSRVAQ